jgi:hypothetical protein
MSDGYPDVPEEAIPEGWERRVRSEETVFSISTIAVVGRTLLYADADLAASLDVLGVTKPASGTDGDGPDRLVAAGDVWRFFFATALSFRPPLAPGIGPAAVYPTVLSEARRSFAEDLQARGFEEVDRERAERVRTETGDRARLAKFTATLPVREGTATDGAVPIEGWLGVWTHSGSFRVAGGAYPAAAPADLLSGDAEASTVDPGEYREELLAMIRAVR